MDTSSIPGLELLQIADVVAREKSIEREEVIAAMEEAIQKAGRSKYGHDRDIRAVIDRKSGSIQLERWTEVVEEVENDATQMGLEDISLMRSIPNMAVIQPSTPNEANSNNS